MKYDNVRCPYCNKPFDADSDVVVCPECGTPHHRECYNEHGKCANEHKHAENFVWENPLAEAKPSEEDNKRAQQENTADNTVPNFADMTNMNSAPNGTIPMMEVDANGNARPVYRVIQGSEKLGENTVDDYAKVIQKNVHKYIPKFLVMEKTNGKVAVNWAAFFFGPLWLFYRKMYKYGIIAMVLIMLFPMIFIGDVVKYGETYANIYGEMAQVMTSDADMTEEELNNKMNDITEKMPIAPVALSISNSIEFAICFLLGLFGNSLYKKHCQEVLKKMKQKGVSEEEKPKYLKRAGGRSLWPVLFAYLIMAGIIISGSEIFNAVGKDLATVLRGIIK